MFLVSRSLRMVGRVRSFRRRDSSSLRDSRRRLQERPLPPAIQSVRTALAPAALRISTPPAVRAPPHDAPYAVLPYGALAGVTSELLENRRIVARARSRHVAMRESLRAYIGRGEGPPLALCLSGVFSPALPRDGAESYLRTRCANFATLEEDFADRRARSWTFMKGPWERSPSRHRRDDSNFQRPAMVVQQPHVRRRWTIVPSVGSLRSPY